MLKILMYPINHLDLQRIRGIIVHSIYNLHTDFTSSGCWRDQGVLRIPRRYHLALQWILDILHSIYHEDTTWPSSHISLNVPLKYHLDFRWMLDDTLHSLHHLNIQTRAFASTRIICHRQHKIPHS